MQNVNKSQLLSIKKFKKLNESELSQTDLERLDSEIRPYEIKLEDYLIAEFPNEEENDIFRYIDNLSASYVADRKYEQLKIVLYDFDARKADFQSIIK